MNPEKWLWMESIVNALIDKKIKFEDVSMNDYKEFTVTIKFKVLEE